MPIDLKSKISALPNRPGVYQFFDEEGKIIYVGKAKKLKNRVSSYFNKGAQLNGKTRLLVKRIFALEFVETVSELDALLLENNLIKQFQPKYNVQLKDDKTFPWICIKNEPFPRIFSTRNKIKDGSEYFGPYASVKLMKTLLELASKLYPLRNCNYSLTKDNIDSGKFKVCLEYHLKNCLGPCEGLQSENDYDIGIKEIKKIIKGNINEVKGHLKEQMKLASEEMDFERAQQTKEKIDMLERYQSKSVVVSPTIKDADVFNIHTDLRVAYINYLKIIDGAVIQSYNLELKKKLEETDEDLLTMAVIDIRKSFHSDCKDIILPFELNIEIPRVTQTIPQKGDKKSLLELAERNLKYHVLNQRKQEKIVDPESRKNRILGQIKEDLRLNELPTHIECFDNSNFQGAEPVAACVVFKDGKPSKKDYRHFNIKTVVGPDDFASMEEVVQRRYSRLLKEDLPLPQLIVIDGGKGQLSSAYKSLERLGLENKIAIIGIAKRLEEIYFPNDSIPIYIDKRSESLKVIQQLRNEAHRFGITHHRSRRRKFTLKTELTEIEGIGTKTAQLLLQKFRSVKNIKEANEEQLSKVVGAKKARTIFNFFHQF
ncbi:MAG: excinuclease ABC subunit UvrC [Flavobacteriales bacterium]|nr:excinuclease ABC subunit UvrC [Flavobacteriales bacterium]